jgi:hypothetical protein
MSCLLAVYIQYMNHTGKKRRGTKHDQQHQELMSDNPLHSQPVGGRQQQRQPRVTTAEQRRGGGGGGNGGGTVDHHRSRPIALAGLVASNIGSRIGSPRNRQTKGKSKRVIRHEDGVAVKLAIAHALQLGCRNGNLRVVRSIIDGGFAQANTGRDSVQRIESSCFTHLNLRAIHPAIFAARTLGNWF